MSSVRLHALHGVSTNPALFLQQLREHLSPQILGNFAVISIGSARHFLAPSGVSVRWSSFGDVFHFASTSIRAMRVSRTAHSGRSNFCLRWLAISCRALEKLPLRINASTSRIAFSERAGRSWSSIKWRKIQLLSKPKE